MKGFPMYSLLFISVNKVMAADCTAACLEKQDAAIPEINFYVTAPNNGAPTQELLSDDAA